MSRRHNKSTVPKQEIKHSSKVPNFIFDNIPIFSHPQNEISMIKRSREGSPYPTMAMPKAPSGQLKPNNITELSLRNTTSYADPETSRFEKFSIKPRSENDNAIDGAHQNKGSCFSRSSPISPTSITETNIQWDQKHAEVPLSTIHSSPNENKIFSRTGGVASVSPTLSVEVSTEKEKPSDAITIVPSCNAVDSIKTINTNTEYDIPLEISSDSLKSSKSLKLSSSLSLDSIENGTIKNNPKLFINANSFSATSSGTPTNIFRFNGQPSSTINLPYHNLQFKSDMSQSISSSRSQSIQSSPNSTPIVLCSNSPSVINLGGLKEDLVINNDLKLIPSQSTSSDLSFSKTLNSTKLELLPYVTPSWDVNDPTEWTEERVSIWLLQNNFDDEWIKTFRRNNISGIKFTSLVNYQVLKSSGIFTNNTDIKDNSITPSKFIHLLRKALNKSKSCPQSKSLELSESFNNSLTNLLAVHSRSVSDPTLIDATAALEPSISAPNYKITISESDPLTTSNINSAELSNSCPDPNISPLQSSHISNNNTPISSKFNQVVISDHKNEQPYQKFIQKNIPPFKSDTSKSGYGLFTKFRNYRKKEALRKGSMDSLISPILKNKLPLENAHTFRPMSKPPASLPLKVLYPESKYIPTPITPQQESKSIFILSTTDNELFVPVNVILDIDSDRKKMDLSTVKQQFCDAVGYNDYYKVSYHLTDFNCKEGEAMDDLTFENLLLHSFNTSFGTAKIYLKGELISSNLSKSSGTSSNSVPINGHRYPSTPQYLYTSPTNKDIDYLNFKSQADSDLNSASKISGTTIIEPVEYKSNSQNLPSLSKLSQSDYGSDFQNMGNKKSDYKIYGNQPNSDSFFRIIRNRKREINFDKKRDSPFDQAKKEFIAKRPAPPPPSPPKRNQRENDQLSTSKSISISSGSTSPNSPVTYTPGTSTTFIPKPYMGVSLSRKKELSWNVTSVLQKNKSRFRTSFSRSQSISIDQPIARNDHVGEDSDEKFKENEVSFDALSPLQDDISSNDDDSDDGLWAKKPLNNVSLGKNNAIEKIDKGLNDNSQSIISSTSWPVRPPTEFVYENLEIFFPNTDLDNPILDDSSASPYSPISPILESPTNTTKQQKQSSRLAYSKRQKRPVNESFLNVQNSDLTDNSVEGNYNPTDAPIVSIKQKTNDPSNSKRGIRRMKTIRTVAYEAREEYKNGSSVEGKTKKIDALVRRKSTKMWGQKVVEVTPGKIPAGFVSTLRNQKGEYKQFAWVKGELIGKGTFGEVYLALNVTNGEMIAVKQVKVPKGIASQHNREVIEALQSEVNTLKHLDHLNIVQYLGFEETTELYNLFLEYIPGGSIGSCIRLIGRFDEPLIRFITIQVLQGLSYLHLCGILHRDLKADNLLLDVDGVCKISDFGISKRSQNIYANDAKMSMQGTIFWMAPEVIESVVHNQKQGYSAKVDIWSLGCVVLEMFAGRRPWSNIEAIGAIYKIGKTRLAPPIPDDTLPFVSDEGKDFISRCFRVDPEKRPTALELLQHEFCTQTPGFLFTETPLAQNIRLNGKQKIEALRQQTRQK